MILWSTISIFQYDNNVFEVYYLVRFGVIEFG